ncbi:MAG TPA: DUF5985 family protein, partial [Candidatus Baltobacteraceae bacterium]|nr:DUF5985 family protein [Candidatus Baltobacteraceae bacterium]
LYFLKSWQRTEDRLFLFFSAAFGVLGVERLLLAIINLPETNSPPFYVLRLVAFLLILIGIIEKNRAPS